MVTGYNSEQYARAMLLAGSVRQLRRQTDTLGAADAIHQLRNSVLIAQGALSIVETRLSQGRDDDIEKLLDLAETRVREGRALVARTRGLRLGRRPAVLGAA